MTTMLQNGSVSPKFLTGVAIASTSALLVATVTGIIMLAQWRGELNVRMNTFERSVMQNQENIRDLVMGLNANTRETAILSERMQAIIERMDRRRAERGG